MDEAGRRYYLSRLGVYQYTPRWLLAGAAVSVACTSIAGPVLEPSPNARANSVGQPAAPKSLPSRSPPHLNPERSRSTPLAKSDSSAPPLTPENIRPIACNTWRVNDALLVIDTRQARAALPTTRLLINMLQALGYFGELPPVEVLQWPLTKGRVNVEEVRAMLAGYFAAQTERGQLQWVWLMGAPVAQASLTAEQWQHGDGVQLLGQRLPLAHVGDNVQAIVLPSLTSLLQQPALKADAWAAIKSLAGQF